MIGDGIFSDFMLGSIWSWGDVKSGGGYCGCGSLYVWMRCVDVRKKLLLSTTFAIMLSNEDADVRR